MLFRVLPFFKNHWSCIATNEFLTSDSTSKIILQKILRIRFAQGVQSLGLQVGFSMKMAILAKVLERLREFQLTCSVLRLRDDEKKWLQNT